MFVYKVTNTINGKVYIGKTTKAIEERWCHHCWASLKAGSKFRFHNAIRKYGPDAFTIDRIANVDDSWLLNEAEKYCIEHFDSFNSGYNSTIGGDGIGKGCIPWNKGKTGVYSEETLKQKSQSARGKIASEETRQKLSIAGIGRKSWNKGVPRTDEQKKYQSRIMKGRGHPQSEETRGKIRQYHLIPIPDDFVANMGLPEIELVKNYGVSRATIYRWKRQVETTSL